jgi:hypothetical protein
MQNVFIFPDGRKFALCYAQSPLGATHRQDTPLRSPQDIDQLMAYLGGAKVAGIWRDYYLNQARIKSASPNTPLSEISQRIKADLWQGNLYFIPRDDPEDKPENIDQAIRTERTNLQMHLRGIIQEEQKEKAALEAEYKKLNIAEKALVSTGAAATGLGKAGKDFLIWADNIVDVVDINRRAVRIASAAKKTYWEQNKKTWGENIAEAEYKELIEALGFDPTKITREQIKQAIEFTQLIWEDAETRNLLKLFAIDYAKAQHHTEWTEMAGGLSFEIILTLIIAALTGGAGAAAVAAKNMLLIGKLEKAGQALLTIGKKLKSLKVRAKRKLISVKNSLTSSGSSPKSKHDAVDEVMHKASEKPKADEKSSPMSSALEQDKRDLSKLSNEIKAAKSSGNTLLAQQKIDEARDILRPHVKKGDLNAVLERLDVSSPKDGTYFWSGYPDGALTKAEQIAAKNSGISLESTPGGTIVNNWDELNESPISNDFWSAVSKKYASGAEGKVEVIQSDNAFVGGGGKVWKETELPALVREGKVDQITLRDLDGNVREVWDKSKMAEMSTLYNGGP